VKVKVNILRGKGKERKKQQASYACVSHFIARHFPRPIRFNHGQTKCTNSFTSKTGLYHYWIGCVYSVYDTSVLI